MAPNDQQLLQDQIAEINSNNANEMITDMPPPPIACENVAQIEITNVSKKENML